MDSGMSLTEACRAEGLTMGEARVALRMDSNTETCVLRHDSARPPPIRSGLDGLAAGLAALHHVEKDQQWMTRQDRHGQEISKVGDGGDLRRAAAHAHAMTRHAFESNLPEAHRAAAAAHEAVAEMHDGARRCGARR
jgi:hypothetical protein